MKLREHGAAADRPGITFDVGVDGHPAWAPLSFGELCDRVAARAAWLHQQGIKPRDPVAVYATSAADCLLTFMALNWVGAIPALMNGNMPGETAVEYIRRLRATAVLTDAAHRSLLDGRDLGGVPVSRTWPRPGPGIRPRLPRTTATPTTTRSRSRTPRAPPGCQPPSSTPTPACSRRPASFASPGPGPTAPSASCRRFPPRTPRESSPCTRRCAGAPSCFSCRRRAGRSSAAGRWSSMPSSGGTRRLSTGSR